MTHGEVGEANVTLTTIVLLVCVSDHSVEHEKRGDKMLECSHTRSLARRLTRTLAVAHTRSDGVRGSDISLVSSRTSESATERS